MHFLNLKKSSPLTNPKTQFSTDLLDLAAFYSTLGAKVINVTGRYPQCTFTLKVPLWMFWYEHIGYVSYAKFGEQRKVLKNMGRKISGLPECFTLKKETGFSFLDVARVK